MSSQDRKRLIEEVRPLLAQDDDFFIRSGLDFWFTPEGARAKVPVRWKQFLVTWSAIYPLVLGIPLVVALVLRQLGVPQNHYLDLLFSTGSVVWVMVYRYAALLQTDPTLVVYLISRSLRIKIAPAVFMRLRLNWCCGGRDG